MAGYNYVELHGRRVGFDNVDERLFVGKRPYTVTMVAAAGASNVTAVTMTVKDYFGNAIAFPHMMDIWLSDAATGAGLTATTASGAVAAGASGADIATLTTKKALRVQTTAAGVYILSITDSAKTAFKVCAQMPDGTPIVGITLATADYGA